MDVIGFDLVTKDVERLLEFYRRLGVAIPDDAVWGPDGGRAQHVEVELGAGRRFGIDSVELTKGYAPSWRGEQGLILMFSVPSRAAVDDTYAKLTKDGDRGHAEPFDAFWGARYAMVDDPDGNVVGFMSPSDRPHTEGPTL